ncbi:hypothetical protein CTI12_AA111910 [Artemisia annua]|uniref:Uncharacterized protein n=1 Tax=Artemisia annua TaxID=35608 RepID=A0A2U1PTZ3_ARTAN|nr:hypothetical protein CTI12_AA111910 [Artemisia annua]
MVSTPMFDQLKAMCGSDESKDYFRYLFAQDEVENEGLLRKIVALCDGLHDKIAQFGAMIEEGQRFSHFDAAHWTGMECLVEAQARNGVVLQAFVRLLDVLREAREEKRRHVMVMEGHK